MEGEDEEEDEEEEKRGGERAEGVRLNGKD